jgi:Mg-chelatase subunit ChlD
MVTARRSAAAGLLFHLLLVPATALAAPPTPLDIQCLGILPDEHLIRWSGVGGDIVYEVHRRDGDDPDYECINCDDLFGPLSADSEGVFLGEAEFPVPDSNLVYRYRVRAVDPEDDSKSSFSDIVRSPTWTTGPDFRVFYNTSECPPLADAKLNCLANTDTAGFISDVASGALAHFDDLMFAEVNFDAAWDRFPINMKACDGVGCARGWGIALSPQFFDLYDHTTNTGKAESVFITVHELFHKIQGAYGTTLQTDPAKKWVTEGQARAIQDLMCVPIGGDDCVHVDDDETGNASYHGQLNNYLCNPNEPITEIEYDAAIFWTFLCDRFGTTNSEPERGIDFLRRFWEEADTGSEDRDGIQVIDDLLADDDVTFKDAFQDFTVTNYTKEFPNVSAGYKYFDESPNKVPVAREVSAILDVGDQIGPQFSDVQHWGAKYFEVAPLPALPDIAVEFTVQTAAPAFFALIAIRNDAVVEDIREVTKTFNRVLVNDPGQPFSRVCVVVAAFEEDTNFFYSFNAEGPNVTLRRPTESQRTYVGTPAAPEKFVSVVQVVTANANPILGLDAADFSFEVGGHPVTNVLQSLYAGGGQYWFVLQAPPQAAEGLYSLTVEWSMLDDTEPEAVQYGSAASDPSANVVTLDRTPSMIDPGFKLSAARTAARVFVDSFQEGDKIGVVGFSGDGDTGCEATSHFPLVDWTEDSREAANDEIIAITGAVPSGRTSVGDGLFQALEELDKDEGESPVLAAFLLSDGDNNCSRDIEDFLDEWRAREADGDPVPEVHTLAIGNDAEREILEELADETGGTYDFVPEPPPDPDSETSLRFGLVDVHRKAAIEISRVSQNFAVIGNSRLGESPQHSFVVDQGASELVVNVSWPETRPSLIGLTDPDGIADYQPAYAASRHEMFKILLPKPGFWLLSVLGVGQCPIDCGTPYIADASVDSILTMVVALGLPVEERLVGRPVPILAALSDTQPVTGASVAAHVRNPLDQDTVLALFDDGAHGDGAADDGVYGGVYFQTWIPGSYRAQILALGSTPIVGGFARRQRVSFHMRAGENPDGDCESREFPWGMPSHWEEDHGLDPMTPDSAFDPDMDGIDSCHEYQIGTHPQDPDTDDDGESDGSEDANGRDPRDPTDGAVRPPRLACYGHDGYVEVRFSVPEQAVALEISRAIARGSFSVIEPSFRLHVVVDTGLPPRAVASYRDRRVVNGETYSYRLVALTAGGARSAPSRICAATPKRDPYPPFGSVLVNGGARVTPSLVVDLTLLASDVQDPENEDEDPPNPDAAVSGVADMSISNAGHFRGAVWVPYEVERAGWRLDPEAVIDGTATVYARYRDHAGNVSETVHASIRLGCDEDAVPPEVLLPAPVVTATACSAAGARVRFEVEALDNCGAATVLCVPASGSLFPLGDTVVACSARDESGNQSVASFTVQVTRGGVCFVRGDCDADGFVGGSVNDPVFYLNWAFGGGPTPECRIACDADGDGFVGGSVNDAVYYLNWAFVGGPPPDPPFPDCGESETPVPPAIDCATPPRCP